MADRLIADLSVPAIARSRRVNGIHLHCIEAGPEDGPLVLLLHGFPEFWWGWRRQIGALAEAGFRVVVPDQRGYNLSDKPSGRKAYALNPLAGDVIALADAYGRRTFHLVGHDWGGIVAWWAAARHADRIERLVILNAPHPGVAGAYVRSHPAQMLKSAYVGFFKIPRLPERLLARDDYGPLKRSLVRSSRRGTFAPADLDRYREAWSQPGALTAMLNWYRALPLVSDPPLIARLPMPVQILWGTQDPFLSRGLAEASLAVCDRGRARWFETATHWVHLEEAEAVNAAMLAFLKSPASAPPA
jgi:pimeloyl-ACP methyl ester carboxylesterase